VGYAVWEGEAAEIGLGEEYAVTRKKPKQRKSREEQVPNQGPAEETRQSHAERVEAPLPEEPFVSPEEEEEPRAESEAAVLQEEIGLLETQLQSLRDRYIRAVADLDNARKRARRAILEAREEAVAGVLVEVLSVVDDFERALETARAGPDASSEMQAVYEGIELIYRRLMRTLERRDVRPIEALGEPFDPTRHEAVAQVPAGDEVKEGTVALETQKGYVMGERVLRPSRVGVAVPDPKDDA
jgi:molecular chaperone GrpE